MNKLPQFKIRCSALSKIMSGTIGLTDTQKATLSDLESRENGTHPKGLKLTARMEVELAELQYKRLYPELPQGSKTYCEEYLGWLIDGRMKAIQSKYIEKGNSVEEDSFTLMAVQLGLGMIFKNEERKSNGWMEGECDIDHNGIIYDNKASWEYGTFPMWKKENPNIGYEHQLQGYMELWDREEAILCYTLVDCPEYLLANEMKHWLSDDERQKIAKELIFTRDYWDAMKSKYFSSAKKNEFIEIPEKRRVKTFKFKRDREFIKEAKFRTSLCQKYIESLLSCQTNKK